MKDFRKTLQSTLDRVTECVEPLCGVWLEPTEDGKKQTSHFFRPLRKTWLINQHNTASEQIELQFIRSTYIPEIILAYHSTLYFAGHTVGREILTHCMTLATIVSGSDDLIASFMASERMRELVDAFALSSMALMSARDLKVKKKLGQSETVDIWKMKPSQKGE